MLAFFRGHCERTTTGRYGVQGPHFGPTALIGPGHHLIQGQNLNPNGPGSGLIVR